LENVTTVIKITTNKKKQTFSFLNPAKTTKPFLARLKHVALPIPVEAPSIILS
jgi:hypothetical protein